MKKLSLGLAVLLSGVTLGAAAAATSPLNITVPTFNGGFTFGLAGLYSQPSTNDDAFAALVRINSVSDSLLDIHGNVKHIDADYDWAYGLNVGYMIPCTSNDIVVSYSNFHHTYHDSVAPGTDELLVATNGLVDADDYETVNSVTADTRYKYQALDLEVGQHLFIGCNNHVRLLAGVRLAEVDSKFITHENIVDTEVSDFSTHQQVTENNRFRGIGPRLGAGFDYNLGNGFGVVGQATGALLIGQLKSDANNHVVLANGTDSLYAVNVDFVNHDRSRVVPNVTAKLGLNYNYQLCNASHTRLTFEAGYQADHYLNVIDRSTFNEDSGLISKKADVAFDGPYVSLQVRI